MKKTTEKPKQRKGFAVIEPALQRKIASMGGKAVSKDRRHMADIGRIGGEAKRNAKAA